MSDSSPSSLDSLAAKLGSELDIDDPDQIRLIRDALESAKKQGKETLGREQVYLDHLMRHLPDRIYFKDTQSRFILGNDAFVEFFGMEDAADILGKTDFDFFPRPLAAQKFEDELQIMRDRKIVHKDELDAQSRGMRTWSSTTKMPLVGEDGEVVGTFGLSRDITDSKLAEEKLISIAEDLKLKNEQIETDLEMARKLQTAFIPTSYPSFMWDFSMEGSALTFDHLYVPTEKLAGDFFQVIPISNKKAGILICDVMGHGIRASLVTAILRGLVGELKLITPYPHVFLRKVNRSLNSVLKQLDITLFVTAFYGVIDLERGLFHYSNAGHPLPIQVKRNEGKVATLPQVADDPDPALGLLEVYKYSYRSVPIHKNDGLFVYTDGIIEMENRFNREYGIDAMKAFFSKRTNASCSEILRALVKEIEEHMGDMKPLDDMCMVGVDINELAVVSD